MMIDKVMSAISLSRAIPGVIIVHPITWQRILEEDAEQGFRYSGGMSPGGYRFKGIPVYRSFDLEEGEIKVFSL